MREFRVSWGDFDAAPPTDPAMLEVGEDELPVLVAILIRNGASQVRVEEIRRPSDLMRAA